MGNAENGESRKPVLGEGETRWDRWWTENRDAHNDARRQRYHSDPEYRDRIRRAARERQRAKPGVLVPRVKTQVRPVLAKLVINGTPQEVLVYHRQDVANAIGISVERLKLWFRQGFVPKPTYTNERSGFGVFTRDQLELLSETAAEVFRGQRPTRQSTHRFAALVQERWARIPGGVGNWRG